LSNTNNNFKVTNNLLTRFNKIRLIIPLILSHYLECYDDSLKKLVELYLELFEHRLKHRGLADTLSYFKKVRLSFTR